MAKQTVKAKRMRSKALERRQENTGESRPKGSEEGAHRGEEAFGEAAPRAPSPR